MSNRTDDYAGDDLAFREWMAAVDRNVDRMIGLSVMDLADQPFRDWFDDGLTPAEAARYTLEEEGLEEL